MGPPRTGTALLLAAGIAACAADSPVSPEATDGEGRTEIAEVSQQRAGIGAAELQTALQDLLGRVLPGIPSMEASRALHLSLETLVGLLDSGDVSSLDATARESLHHLDRLALMGADRMLDHVPDLGAIRLVIQAVAPTLDETGSVR